MTAPRLATHRGYTIELTSYERPGFGWEPQAVVYLPGRIPECQPIMSMEPHRFPSCETADAYALTLARVWIEGRGAPNGGAA